MRKMKQSHLQNVSVEDKSERSIWLMVKFRNENGHLNEKKAETTKSVLEMN